MLNSSAKISRAKTSFTCVHYVTFIFFFFVIVLFKQYSAAVRDLSVIVNSVFQAFVWRNLFIDNG